jgi:hypothetical protein
MFVLYSSPRRRLLHCLMFLKLPFLGPLLFNTLIIHIAISKHPVFFLLLMENKNVDLITSVDDFFLQPDVNSE